MRDAQKCHPTGRRAGMTHGIVSLIQDTEKARRPLEPTQGFILTSAQGHSQGS